MAKTYMGLDCLLDQDADEYSDLKKISQSGVHAWGYQANYGYYTTYFGAVLLFLLVLKKMVYMYTDYSYRNSGLINDKKSFKAPVLNKLSAASRYLAYKRWPLILSRISGLPSSFGSLFVLFSATLYLLCYTFIPKFWYRECSGFGSPPLAVRTAMMVMALTPFLFIISGKTNFISGVTGISYEKLNVYHQSLGWASLFLSLVHTIPFLVQDAQEGGSERLHAHWNEEPLYRNGVPPLIFLFSICVLGSRYVRKYVYEIFWHSHWILGLAYFATLTYHAYGSLNSEQYMWGTLGFWGAQMLYRMILKSPLKPNDFVFRHKEAKVKALHNGLYEITVPISSHYEFYWKPGQHLFLRFMHGIHTLDNHPFSILTVPRVRGETQMKLIVKAQGGLTKKIYEEVLGEKNCEKHYKVFIDGPYGGMNRDSLAFDKLILVASGTGVTVTFPFMLYLVQFLGNPTSRVQSVEFLWVISSAESLNLIKDQLIELLNQVSAIDPKLLSMFKIDIFVTNSKEGTVPNVVSSRSQLEPSSKKSVGLHLYNDFKSKEIVTDQEIFIDESNYEEYLNIYIDQKPNLNAYIAESQLLEKNAVICSGTASLQADVGNAASQLQKEVMKSDSDIQEIYLHTENFGW